MEEKYGIRRFPYPAYGAQLAMARLDPNSGRLILPTHSRLRGSAPAFVPGQPDHLSHDSRAQSPASLPLRHHTSRRQQDQPLNRNGPPGNYYQLSQQLLRTAPAISAGTTPEPQAFNTQDRSVQERNLGSDLLQQEPDQRGRAPDALTTSAAKTSEAHEHRIQDIECNLLQAFAVSNDAAAPHEAANQMLASKAFATPSLALACPRVQIDQSIRQRPAPNECAWAMSNSQEATGTAMQQGFSTTSRNTGFSRLLAATDDGADDEANLDPALRRTQKLQGDLSHGVAPQAGIGETSHSASASNGPIANVGQPQQNLGGHQPRMSPGLTINTRIRLTKAQDIELAKEKIAHHPSQPIPTDRFTIGEYVGRPPSVLCVRIPKPQQDTRNWFSEFTADELLHHMHPDDMCGTVILEIAKQYSGAEIAGFANQLYELRGGAKGDVSTNGFTKRITLAVKHLCQDVNADRQRVLDALANDRSAYRMTGTPGSKAETVIQGIRDRQMAQASSAAVRAPAFQVLQPSMQATASGPNDRPANSGPCSQTVSHSFDHGSTGTHTTPETSKRKRSNLRDETEAVQQPKRAKHDESHLEGEGSDEDAEFEYEDMI